MKVDGMIVCHDKYGPLGLEQRDFEWTGGSLAYISNLFMSRYTNERDVKRLHGDILQIGPFKVRIIEFEWGYGRVLVIREGWYAPFYYYWRIIGRRMDRVYRKMIVTLAVWDLADYNPATIPYWKDIHALRWLVNKWRQITA